MPPIQNDHPINRAGTQAYGASAGPPAPAVGYHNSGGPPAPAGQTSYDTAYPNTAAFAGWFLFYTPILVFFFSQEKKMF